MRETEVEEYEGQGEEGELEASCDIVSVRSWRGVRARGGTFCTEPAHRDTGRDQASNLAMGGVAGTCTTQRSTKAPRGVTAIILALTAAAIRSVDSQGGRGAQWQPDRAHAIPTSLSGQQCSLNP